MTIYAYGQPQYLQIYFDNWLERNRDIAPGVKIEIVQTKDVNDAREKISMTYLSGAMDDLPTATMIDPVSLIDLAKGGIVMDVTDDISPQVPNMVDGACSDATLGGKIYGYPDSVRPQLLFYNQRIFDKYGVDPAQMETIEGWIEAGRQLKEKSNGETYLSYIDPTSRTWRYYGRRGLMPQADAHIWDDQGNVVIGSDPGAKLAFTTLDTLCQEDLLFKSAILEPPMYDSIREDKIATFYIGAFWDEFLRLNVPETAGDWRVMKAPVFKEIGTGERLSHSTGQSSTIRTTHIPPCSRSCGMISSLIMMPARNGSMRLSHRTDRMRTRYPFPCWKTHSGKNHLISTAVSPLGKWKERDLRTVPRTWW